MALKLENLSTEFPGRVSFVDASDYCPKETQCFNLLRLHLKQHLAQHSQNYDTVLQDRFQIVSQPLLECSYCQAQFSSSSS